MGVDYRAIDTKLSFRDFPLAFVGHDVLFLKEEELEKC